MHVAAVAAMEHFRNVKRGELQAINIKMNEKRMEIIAKNRSKLLPIVKAVAFCGKQTIALRDHRDDETMEDESLNKGNFQELFNFRIDSGDRILEEHFQTAPKNSMYRSKTIQNEIIDSLEDHLTDSIVKEVKKAKIFTIMADETPDVS